jgi:hypothetical protein
VKAYLLTYSSIVTPHQANGMLNRTAAIETWVSPFPYAAIIISRLTINELAAVLQTHFADAWFMVAEVNRDNCNGWLPKQLWDYVTDPQTAWSQQLLANLLKTQVSLPPPPPPGLRRILPPVPDKKKP